MGGVEAKGLVGEEYGDFLSRQELEGERSRVAASLVDGLKWTRREPRGAKWLLASLPHCGKPSCGLSAILLFFRIPGLLREEGGVG